MTFLLTIAYFSILFFFGWQAARWILHENRIEHLITFAGVFGIGLYTFFVNVMGIFLPIQIVFYLVLLIFLLLAGVCVFCRRFQILNDQRPLEWGTNSRWRGILLFSALFIALSVGLISFRHPMDRASVREPTATTIAEGNFPPVEIFNPADPLRYHYAPDLFAAATYKVTGMPLYVAYDLERGMLSGVLFLLGFLLVLLFFQGQFFVAFFSSVLMMYAGSLVFLNIFSGISTVYQRFILGRNIVAPFKFVTDAITGEYTAPVINSVVGLHWGAMAFALTLAVVYLYFFLLQRENSRHTITAFFASGCIFALLALVSEPYFAVLCIVIFLFPFALFFFKRDWPNAKKVFISSFILLAIALPAAFFQGGLLRSVVVQQLNLSSGERAYDSILYTSSTTRISTHSFKVGTPWLLYNGKPVYDPRFLAEFILLLTVLVPSLIFLFKQRFQLALFLTGLLVLLFFIPLFVDSNSPDLATQMVKFFSPIPLFGGLVAGLYLTMLYQRARRSLLKGALLFLTLILMAQGFWTHVVWLTFGDPPGGTLNPNAHYFAQVGTPESAAYAWIKKNTTIHDLFLIIKDTYSDCGAYGAPNCLFVLNTGRMAPTFAIESNTDIALGKTSSQDKAVLFSEVNKNCDPDILQELHYRYLYVDDQWSKGVEATCSKNNELDLVFQVREDKKFVRIYKIKEDTPL